MLGLAQESRHVSGTQCHLVALDLDVLPDELSQFLEDQVVALSLAARGAVLTSESSLQALRQGCRRGEYSSVGSLVSLEDSLPRQDLLCVGATGPCAVPLGGEALHALAEGLRLPALLMCSKPQLKHDLPLQSLPVGKVRRLY